MIIDRRVKSAETGNRSLAEMASVITLIASVAIATPDLARSEPWTGRPLWSGLSANASAKVDARLILALSVPRDEESLRSVSRIVPVFGERAEDLSFAVLIQSSLSDAELSGLGVQRNSRIGDTVTARVSEGVLARVAAHPNVSVVEPEPWLQSTLDRSTVDVQAYTQTGASTTGFTGGNVLYGLIDDGIDLTHDDFKDAAGNTRVLYVWDHFFDGNPPSGFDYGTEYTAAQIDGGQAGAFINEGGHGSHVAGISVGDGSSAGSPFRGVAPEASIIAVRNGYCDLFCYGGGGPWGKESTRGSLDGLVYLKQKAQTLGRPLVINQSQGVMMGPHDGSTLFEQKYDQLVAQNNLIVTVAAGNDQTSSWHGSVDVSRNGQETMQLIHGGKGAQEQLWFELWWNEGQQYQISLRTPSNEILTVQLETGGVSEQATSHGDTVLFFSTQQSPANRQGQALFLVQGPGNGAFAETGAWEVTVESRANSSGRVHLYCERNQLDLKVQNPDLTAIVAMPGTAANVITVGSYNTRFDWVSVSGPFNAPIDGGGLGGLSDFSSQGPRRDGVLKPDISAPGQWIISSLAAGHQTQNVLIEADGVHMALTGTSMASPHVAGAIALMLQKDPTLTFTEVKQILKSTARQDGFTGSVPNARFGAGKLDVQAAVEAVEGANLCAVPGDANVSGNVNVADVVAAVNHIFGTPLPKSGLLCADLVGNDNQVTVNDVTAIVNVIVNGTRPARPTGEEVPRTIAWGERTGPGQFELFLDPREVGSFQMAFALPRGYVLDADPYLVGAGSNVALDWSQTLNVHQFVAYSTNGALLSAGDELRLVIPVRQDWIDEEGMERFVVEHLRLSGPTGEPLALTDLPSLGGQTSAGGVRSYLSRIYPNPMVELTKISYDLARSGTVELTVFSASGRIVRTLPGGYQVSGSHTVHWDGHNDAGEEVADGVYFVRLETEFGAEHEKIHVVR